MATAVLWRGDKTWCLRSTDEPNIALVGSQVAFLRGAAIGLMSPRAGYTADRRRIVSLRIDRRCEHVVDR